jgi:Phospholipid methyltransferase
VRDWRAVGGQSPASTVLLSATARMARVRWRVPLHAHSRSRVEWSPSLVRSSLTGSMPRSVAACRKTVADAPARTAVGRAARLAGSARDRPHRSTSRIGPIGGRRRGWHNRPQPRPGPLNLVGLVPISAGGALIVWALARHYTQAPDKSWRITRDLEPEYLLTDGPYRLSRNPMFVGGIAVWAGWTILFGSARVAAGLHVVIGTMRAGTAWEEQMLERRFGDRMADLCDTDIALALARIDSTSIADRATWNGRRQARPIDGSALPTRASEGHEQRPRPVTRARPSKHRTLRAPCPLIGGDNAGRPRPLPPARRRSYRVSGHSRATERRRAAGRYATEPASSSRGHSGGEDAPVRDGRSERRIWAHTGVHRGVRQPRSSRVI